MVMNILLEDTDKLTVYFLLSDTTKAGGKRKYGCHICSKLFTKSSHRKEHERIHTGEKPYKCEFCERRFTTKGNLKAHQVTHRDRLVFL